MLDLIVSGVIGGVSSLVLREVGSHVLGRFLRRGEFAIDGIIDIMATLHGIEAALNDEKTSPKKHGKPTCIGELRASPDTWHLRGPSITLTTYLATLDNNALHRALILFFDQFARFETRRTVHREAFYWLLDTSQAWTAEPTKERQEQLESARGAISNALSMCLLHGYEAASQLAELADNSLMLNRVTQGSVDQYLMQHYQLDRDRLRAKAHRYRQDCLPAPSP